MRIERDLQKALAPYIIEAALPLVLERLAKWPIRLDFSDRSGRILGFYRGEIRRLFRRRADRIEHLETISLQISLNPYALLLIFIHEWAHLLTHRDYPQARPHGKEWRRLYRQEAQAFLRSDIFPSDVLAALEAYFRKPGAYWDDRLATACAPYGKDRKAFERIYKRSLRRGLELPAPVTYRLAYGRAGERPERKRGADADLVRPTRTSVAELVAAPAASVPAASVAKPSVASVVPVVPVQAGALALPVRARIQNRWARLEKRQGDYLTGTWEDSAKSMRVHVGAEVGVMAEKPGQPQSLDE